MKSDRLKVRRTRFLRSKHDLFLTLTQCFLYLNLTRVSCQARHHRWRGIFNICKRDTTGYFPSECQDIYQPCLRQDKKWLLCHNRTRWQPGQRPQFRTEFLHLSAWHHWIFLRFVSTETSIWKQNMIFSKPSPSVFCEKKAKAVKFQRICSFFRNVHLFWWSGCLEILLAPVDQAGLP